MKSTRKYCHKCSTFTLSVDSMCIYVYVCIHVCMCACACVYTCICMHVSVCVHVCVCLRVHVYICMCMLCMHVCACVCMCVCVHVHACRCMCCACACVNRSYDKEAAFAPVGNHLLGPTPSLCEGQQQSWGTIAVTWLALPHILTPISSPTRAHHQVHFLGFPFLEGWRGDIFIEI